MNSKLRRAEQMADKVEELFERGLRGYHNSVPVKQSYLERVHVIPHTHWDREWYMTSASYRAILIELLDGLMDILDENPHYRSFTFDGQVAPIDDYLAALPEQTKAATEARLRHLISSGRIQIGPWYTLSDQFLVSGETTLRNLERGMERAKDLGALMDIAYCPDQFGLAAELPKILRHVGITRAVGERGMKRGMPQRFLWRGSDGSEVEMLNLKAGYYHRDQTTAEMRRLAKRFKGEPALLMAGFDHSVPTADIADAAQESGAQMSSLPEYWADLGELRSPATHVGEIRAVGDKALLPNVISNRVDQRLEVARAELALERYAEPLAVFCYDVYPAKLLEDVWTNQLWNAAHDSACATGIDEVTREVRVRARETYDTAEGIADHALKQLGGRMRQPGRYVWNPSNFARDFRLQEPDSGRIEVASQVPGLGWARLERGRRQGSPPLADRSPVTFFDQTDRGDTYTFDPKGKVRQVELPLSREQHAGEPFSRLRVSWENADHDHRVRLHIKLPQEADHTIADTAFGCVTRPAIPELTQGRDRLNGYPAGKFILAGGLAILVDRVAEYELLPETGELAITLVRAHGALSVGGTKYRKGGAGPRLPTHGTQMHQEIAWELAVMPWPVEQGLPWQEWEQFMLPGRVFTAAGGSYLPERGTYFQNLPPGVLSAVLPDKVRAFEAGGAFRILTAPLELEAPGRSVGLGDIY